MPSWSAKLRHHLKADVNSPVKVQKQITSVLDRTAAGLAGHVQLSDALSRYMWNLYDVQDASSWADARVELSGKCRVDNPDYPRGGFVLENEREEKFLNVTRTSTKIGSIHIEFSYAPCILRPFLAYAIVHEATHKFASTR